MNIYLASLNSGSNGNCYYVGNDHDAVLIDAGISCRETERRMTRSGLSIRKVRAIFISHDRTGMNRDIGYFAFDRQGYLEAEFAIWQFELDGGRVEITRRTEGPGHFKL